MLIGEVAKASGVSARMIRHYEQNGLMPAAQRSDSGYRVYTPNDVHRLTFIWRARELGFSLSEIAELLDLWDDQSRRSADVKALAKRHIADLEGRIAKMQQMAETLATLVQSCAGDDRPDCPILQQLQEPAK